MKNIKINKKTGYTKPRDLHTHNDIEYGRHFGKWICLNCNKSWASAYTWISTDFCINNKDNYDKGWYDSENLNKKDFILEECKDCTPDNNVKITQYRKLKPNKKNNIVIPHRRDLCAKCKGGKPCQSSTE
jgi:hypothetical protein